MFRFAFGLITWLVLVPFLAGQALSSAKLATTGAVVGIVLDENGKPVPGATVYALPEMTMTKQYHTETNQAGSFALKGVPGGELYLSAFKESDGYPYNFFSFFLSPGENIPLKLSLKAGETLNGIRIQLGKRAARLNVNIISEDGTPFEGAAELIFTRPDMPGEYSIAAKASQSLLVPPVAFQISVKAVGYTPWRLKSPQGDQLVLKSGETFNLVVRLTKAPS